MHIYHVVPLRQSHYAVITGLITAGHLRHNPAVKLQQDHPTGPIYQPVRRVALEARSDTTVQLGTRQVAADLWRLPTAEYQAIQGQYFQVDPAVQTIGSALQANVRTADLRALLEHPLQGTSTSAGGQEAHIQAIWCREKWAVMPLGQHWFLVLWFKLARAAAVQSFQTGEVALDVGLDPLVHVVRATGFSWSVWANGSAQSSLLRPSLNQPERHLLDRALFNHHRHHLLTLTESLVREASAVYAERLTYPGMHRPFVRYARRTGLLDWHESWLHTRLHLAGVRFERVDPTGTSQRCSGCDGHPYGQRRANLFVCHVCGAMDAHENAGRNILRLGRQKAAQWDMNHLGKGVGGRS